MINILTVMILLVLGLLLFGVAQARSRFELKESREYRATVAGFGLGLVATTAELIWLFMWMHIPPVHPQDYWKFLVLSVLGLLTCAVALVVGLFSRGMSRLQIIAPSLVAGVSIVLTTLLSIRFS